MNIEISGNKDHFAIQWEVLRIGTNDWYGSFCVWIANQMIGKFHFELMLNVTLYHLGEFQKHKNIRSFRDSHLLSKEQLFYELYERFFSEDALKTGDHLNLGIYRAIFWLSEIGQESLIDDYTIILLDEPLANRQRLLWKSLLKEDLQEHSIPLNYFEEVASEYQTQVLNFCERSR